MSNQLPTIAKNIRKLRKEKELSQDRLSKMADVSYNSIMKIESGAIQSPGIDIVQKIAKALGVSVDKLIS
jgi:transcriptional regulator with XRE-family HTH domain